MNFLIYEARDHTFGVIQIPNYFQESGVIQLRNNFIPKSNVDLEVEPKKCMKVRLECSKEQKEILIYIYHEFPKVISWNYDDLKIYDKNVIQNTIELELEVNP